MSRSSKILAGRNSISFMLFVSIAVMYGASSRAMATPAPAPQSTQEQEEACSNEGLVTCTAPLMRAGALSSLQLGLQYGTLYAVQPPNWQDHGNTREPSLQKLRSNGRRPPVWEPERLGGGGGRGLLQADGDDWTTNVVGHGLQGSEVYLRMRREGFHWLAATAIGLTHSTLWEYGIEGWNETPSAWDLAYTPVGGALLGEVRYQLWRRNKQSAWVRVLADPIGELVASLQR